ncbi:MAG: POTRA domain-containing protein, partial [Bacteroidales bacterium]|nr:POTRA domain-containing protein [Bacteroidales bacterium]
MKSSLVLLLITLFIPFKGTFSQDTTFRSTQVDYNNPRNYIIGGLTVSGVKYIIPEQILSITGLAVGDSVRIPGEELSSALKRIWMQRFFSDAAFYIDSVKGDAVYLNFYLQERPRVSRWSFDGVKSTEKTDLEEKVKLRTGSELSDYIISSSSELIRKYYVEKGFLQTEVTTKQENDTTFENAVKVTFVVDRKERVRIQQITFEGNHSIKSNKLAAAMKKTKDKRIINFFSSKKFNEEEYDNDKKLLIQAYSERGFRDAKILRDSIYYLEDGKLGINFLIEEGKRYYFRNVTWTGNSIFSSDRLNATLRINKGDIYDVVSMEERLYREEEGNVS